MNWPKSPFLLNDLDQNKTQLENLLSIFLIIHGYFVCMYICQKRASEPLGVELESVVSPIWVLEIKHLSSGKVASAPNHSPIARTPVLAFLIKARWLEI